MLALHFGRSNEAEKSVNYAILAAEKAQRRWANSEALNFFTEALHRLDLMPDTDANRLRRVDAVLKQGDGKFALGEHAEHIQALDNIRPLVDQIGDPRRSATWHYWRGWAHSMTGAGRMARSTTVTKRLSLPQPRAWTKSEPMPIPALLTHTLPPDGCVKR
jgi:hypothetical protein